MYTYMLQGPDDNMETETRSVTLPTELSFPLERNNQELWIISIHGNQKKQKLNSEGNTKFGR